MLLRTVVTHTGRGRTSVGHHSLYDDWCERREYAGSRERGKGGKCNVYSSLRGIHAGRGRGDFATSRVVVAVNMVRWFLW